MEFTAQQIADFVGGRVEGDAQAKVHTFSKIEEGKEGAITFLSNPKYTHYIYDTKASIVLINEDVELEGPLSTTLIRVANAYECVAKLMQMYAALTPQENRHRLTCLCIKIRRDWQGRVYRTFLLCW